MTCMHHIPKYSYLCIRRFVAKRQPEQANSTHFPVLTPKALGEYTCSFLGKTADRIKPLPAARTRTKDLGRAATVVLSRECPQIVRERGSADASIMH